MARLVLAKVGVDLLNLRRIEHSTIARRLLRRRDLREAPEVRARRLVEPDRRRPVRDRGDRLREPVYRALMRLHACRGERTEALKLYAACSEVLKLELGVAPDAKTEELYRDILTDRVSRAPEDASERERTAERPSIAVLPFSNLSGDEELGHLCDGITEDVITGLGRFRLLFVIDRHSSSAVSQQASDVADIGRRLGVRYLVQGSLQRLAERIRITVRLIDTGNRAQL